MQVNISEITSTVRTIDGGGLLTPAVMQRIVQAVLEAMRAEEAHEKRIHDERSVMPASRDTNQHGLTSP